MTLKYKYQLALMVYLFISILFPQNIFGQDTDIWWKNIQQGFAIQLMMGDQGWLGLEGTDRYDEYIGCEYPAGSGINHLFRGGLWVGALVDISPTGPPQYLKLVTETCDFDSVGWTETTTIDTAHPFYQTSIFVDSNAVSESDISCEYTDTVHREGLAPFTPLGIKVWQRSYAWANAVRQPIIIIAYNIVNLGLNKMEDVYIGIQLTPRVTYDGTGKNIAGYWSELMTGYAYNPVDDRTTPIGFTILSLPKPLSELNYFYRWYHFNDFYIIDPRFNVRDRIRYNRMSGVEPAGIPPIQEDQPITDPNKNIELLFSFGPFNNWAIGETLKVAYAIVSGSMLKYGPDNLYDNTKAAQTLYARGYKAPVVLPAPKLRFETGFHKVELHWGYTGSGINPMEVWDDANQLVQFYPPDHWRRVNPPNGHTTGGRVFAGYRLYRSEDPAGTAKSFTLIGQWDYKDSVGPKWDYQTGIEITFVDSNLVTGKTYWYSVTSFGIPDFHLMEYVDRDGTIKKETLATKSLETSLLASRKRMKLPFSVSNELNQVAVVPNPYRINEDYTFESGGYEGRQKSWTEDKRLLKFIHLPQRCTIRIYTLTGEIVSTIYHEDPTQGEHDWDLKSDSNRSIASGVYVFTVESDYGKQIGKFVVIR